ncbi:MAG TPA: ribonuclease P protein component [Oscillatoriales cyanobacterium M59_W2019_021]|nr:MAG: ribonuclease P protein component [Cyanobacteria bacterium J055]HIK32776.1 ribonuclease P protein component [Oscillatoriales cyanobacterium M4454_W2019_049]HIK51478.1 ribonuclease P protein component [Oscillatoriales cyanobacterium M59_W2019_021]
MLPKANRLRHWRDFQTIYQQGIRWRGDLLMLRAWRRTAADPVPTRFGISVSRKFSKHAVTRNRIKRQIRAALHHLLPDIVPGWDCIIVVKPTDQTCNYDRFLQELKQLLAKAEVLNGHSRGNVL